MGHFEKYQRPISGLELIYKINNDLFPLLLILFLQICFKLQVGMSDLF